MSHSLAINSAYPAETVLTNEFVAQGTIAQPNASVAFWNSIGANVGFSSNTVYAQNDAGEQIRTGVSYADSLLVTTPQLEDAYAQHGLHFKSLSTDWDAGQVRGSISYFNIAFGASDFAVNRVLLPETVLWTFEPSAVSKPETIDFSALDNRDPNLTDEEITPLRAAFAQQLVQKGYTHVQELTVPYARDLFTDRIYSTQIVAYQSDWSTPSLLMTDDAMSFVAQALELDSQATADLWAVNEGNGAWGSFYKSVAYNQGIPGIGPQNLSYVVIVPEYPEPSTYALMGLGLAGVVFASRRKRAALA